MGKGRDKKKNKNKDKTNAKSKEKEELKAKKKNQKKNQDNEEISKEEDIDYILNSLRLKQELECKVTKETISELPTRRVNGSLFSNPLNSNELILFGGEYFDGKKIYLYNELFKYNIAKNEWTKITSPNSPGPRSGHQMIAVSSGKAFLFGGEFVSPNETNFFHYKDFWSLNLENFSWEKLEIKRPTPRSGHRLTIWKNFIILFGGFYDVGVKIQYMDDCWIFDTLTYEWKKLDLKEPKPGPRSGFQFFTHGDSAFLCGGYYKKQIKGEKSEGVVYDDIWVLKMNPDLEQIRWEKKKKPSGLQPSKRSGCTMIYNRGKGYLFGGVEDLIDTEENLESKCLNDMYSYNCDSNRWFPQTLRTLKNNKSKKDDDKTKLAADEIQSDENSIVESEMDSKLSEEYCLLDSNNDFQPVMFPWPRFNAMIVVVKNTLYIYGGILETKTREYTLNDFWSINLEKMVEWNNIVFDKIDGSEWFGEDSQSEESDAEDEDEDSEEEGDERDNEAEEKLKQIELKQKEFLKQQEENESVPLPGEKLGDYFNRTIGYWQLRSLEYVESINTNKFRELSSDDVNYDKGLRRNAFVWAKYHWKEWQPKLEKLKCFLEENEVKLDDGKGVSQTETDNKESRNRR